MKARFLCILFICAGSAFAGDADLLFVNGNVHTLDERQPHAEAIATKGDRISFVGSNKDAEKFRGPNTKTVDLTGKTVVPGLTDSHCHIFGIGERESNLNLEGANTLEAFLAKVKERVTKTERGKWVTGRGWIETFWKPPQFPTRSDLDKIAPDNPVLLERADGHASIANSAALKIAGITKETPNPFGGEILKDKKTGEPTGMLIDRAQGLVEKHLPQPSDAEREAAFLIGVKREIELGWTGIHNAGSNAKDVDVMRRLDREAKFKLRIYNAVYGPSEEADILLRDGPILPSSQSRFTQRSIKVVLDGALGSRGAALLKPYSDAPESSGFLTAKPEELQPMFEKALRHGIQIQTHAIGDRANRLILDLYEEAFKGVIWRHQPRWRVEHAQIVDLADMRRFGPLEVIPSMQPSHAISDLFFATSRLGMERLSGAYAWKTFINSAFIVAGGSDAPVERGEPMMEFYAAVARKSIKGEQLEGWHPEQAVSREQALKMFTIWPAYAAFEEKERGTIEAPKLADLTVLSADIMKIPEPEILKTRCEMTVIGGEILFPEDASRPPPVAPPLLLPQRF